MAELKYIVFFITLFIGVPIGIILGSKFKLIEKIVLFLSVLFTARMNETINFVSHEFYRGTSRGFEISLVDLLVIVLFGITLLKKQFKDYVFIPKGYILFGGFFFFSVVSIMNSGNALYSSFEVWKLIRMGFVFWVFTNYLDSLDKIKDLVHAFCLTGLYIFVVVLIDKYIHGKFQAKGPFPHQNSMVMYMINLGGIAFTLFLHSTKRAYYAYGFLVCVVTVVIISSLSRAGFVLYFFSLCIVFGMKVLRHKSKKDLLTIGLGVLAFGAILFKASDSLIERFETAPKESAEVRVMLATAALKMANSETFGVGLNNFGLKINYPYPYSKGTPHYYDPDFRGGLVETTYLMIAAESGWHTLVIYLLFLFRMLFLAFKHAFWAREKQIRILAMGIFGALCAIYLESTLEWVLRQTTNFYQLIIIFSMINAFSFLEKKAKNRSKMTQI